MVSSTSNKIIKSSPRLPQGVSSYIDDLRYQNKSFWNRNYPTRRNYSFVSTYKRNGNDKLTKVLLVGGADENGLLSETWIYTPSTNSWFRLPDRLERLPVAAATGFEVLPSLCDVYVIFMYNVENVWLFDGRTETWRRVSVDSPFDERTPISIFYTASVLRRESKCEDARCACAGSVLFYGSVFIRQVISSFTMELFCSNIEDDNMQCHWKSRYSEMRLPYSVVGQIAVSDKRDEAIYFAPRGFTPSYYKDLEYIPVSKLIPGRQSNWIPSYKAFYNMTKIRKTNCNTNSISVWRDKLLLTYDYRNVLAVSLKDESHYRWIELDSKRQWSPKPGACAWQMIENETTSELVRFYWKTSRSRVSVSVYTPVYINNHLELNERWPRFVTTEKSFPRVSPRALRYHVSLYDYSANTFYLYGGLMSGGALWTLSIPSKTWWLIKPEKTPSAYICSCGTVTGSSLIIFGGKRVDGKVSDDLWVYDTKLRLWNQIRDGRYWPLARAGCSLTGAPNGSTLFLFGGYSDSQQALSDVWQLQLTNDGLLAWQEILPHTAVVHPNFPGARFGHSSLIVNDELVIHGGRHAFTQKCLSDMWILNVSVRRWRQLTQSDGKNQSVYSRKSATICSNSILPYGRSKVIVVEDSYENNKLVRASSVRKMISVVTGETTVLLIANRSTITLALGLWNGLLIFYEKTVGKNRSVRDRLTLMGANCSSGSAPSNGPFDNTCQQCSTGTYYSNYLEVGECIRCPIGTTTKECGMTSRSSCTCDPAYCLHGTCKVNSTKNDVSAVCICSFGFTGNRCNNVSQAMLILVTLVPFLAILIVTSLSCCCIRTVRHRRARTRTEKELEETRKAFTIRTPEIEMISRLDEDCPGGYGQVHKATYRDWTVAVKQLQLVMVEWDDVRREFLREIQFMRTVRHPNIVMFIGAGQYNKDQPFLVLEYMGGGALCSLLHKKEVELCAKQKLRFVLEAAKGMDYLHTLKPPRIHRDLKSANLLLSLNWQVKVADFGSARLIPQPDQARATKDKRFQKQSNTDEEKDSKQLLDECSYLTSKHIGTARWRSPEVWKNMSYGTPTDVYRYVF